MTTPSDIEFFEVLEHYDSWTLYRAVSRFVYGSPHQHLLVARASLYHFFQVWITETDPRHIDYLRLDNQSTRPLVQLLHNPYLTTVVGDFTRLVTIVANAHNIRLQVTTTRDFENRQEYGNQKRRHAGADYTIFVPQTTYPSQLNNPQLCEVGSVEHPVFHLGLRLRSRVFSTLLPDWESAEFTELIHRQNTSLEDMVKVMATRPLLIAAAIYNTQDASNMPRGLEQFGNMRGPSSYIQDDLIKCLNAFVGSRPVVGTSMVPKKRDPAGAWDRFPIEERVIILQVPPRLPGDGGFSRLQHNARRIQRGEWIQSLFVELQRLMSQYMQPDILILLDQIFATEEAPTLSVRDAACRETAANLLIDFAHELFLDPYLLRLANRSRPDAPAAFWTTLLELEEFWNVEDSFLEANRLLLDRAYPAPVIQATDDPFRTNYHFPGNAAPFVAPVGAAPPATSRAPPAPAAPTLLWCSPNRLLLLSTLSVLALGCILYVLTPELQQKAAKPRLDHYNQQVLERTHNASASGRLESLAQYAVLDGAVSLAAIGDAHLRCRSPLQAKADGTFVHFKKGCKIYARQRNIRSRSAGNSPSPNMPPPVFGDHDTIALVVIEGAHLKCFPPAEARADGTFVRLDSGCKLIVSKGKIKKL